MSPDRRHVIRWADVTPSGPGRTEALYALARAIVLLFSAAVLAFADEVQAGPAVAAHLVLAAVSIAVAFPLLRLRTAVAARRAAVCSTALDVAACAAYAIAVDGTPGLNTTYLAFTLLMGPLRWALPGVLATGLPVGLIATLWPMPDLSGAARDGLQLWVLVALLTLPVAGLSSLQRRNTARLRQAQDQFEGAFEHASIGMALLDPEHRVIQANPALAALVGAPVEALAGTALGSWVAEQDRVLLDAALAQLPEAANGIRIEVRFHRPGGVEHWGLVAASWLAGSAGIPPRIIAQVEDVTERKTAEARLSHLAQHDGLTGLPNRSLLLAHLESALRADGDVGLVFVDLDRFKVVNDGLGHAAGDRLLQEVARRLRAVMRPGDVVARLGGDEFVALCHGVRRVDEALAVAERMVVELRAPIRLDERSEVVATASVGVTVAGAGATADTLLRDADTAMYAAKSAGGGGVRLFTVDLHERAWRRHELEVDLRRALLEDRLDVLFQPIVDLTTGHVVELESLLRWQDDVRGAVSPTEFIAVAEQSTLIEDVGLWVLDRALHDAAGWPAARNGSPPRVAVNVSPRQLLQHGFADTVAMLLREHALDPGRLCLEVTETAVVEDTSQLVPALHALRQVGVRLAIDDFGTGHASLTYLAQLPVDVVKIDRSFVSGVADEAGSAAIVGGVVAMAGAFGLTVVAEGVETSAQLQGLRRLGVDRVQGFLLARPMPNQAVHEVLSVAPTPRIPAPRDPAAGCLPDLDATQRFRVLLDAARDVTACVDLADVLTTSFTALRRLVSFTGGSIQLVHGDVVRLAATDPPATAEAMGATLTVGTGISGGIAATGEPRYLPDITIAPAVTPDRRTKNTSAGVRSWYGVPLVAEGRVIGVLQIDSTAVDAFDDADRLLVLSFASVVAAAVQTARLFAQELGALQRPPA